MNCYTKNCQRVIRLPDASADEQIRFVQHLLEKGQSHEKYTRIKNWKDRLLSSDLGTFKWLKGSTAVVKRTLYEHENHPANRYRMPSGFSKTIWSLSGIAPFLTMILRKSL